MKGTETKLKGCFILESQMYKDDRGYFFESYNENKLNGILGFTPKFVQDNQSRSSYGVVRGLHLQTNENAQAKLVRVLEGAVLDVAVDVRLNSPTFGQWVGVEISAENQKQLFVPRGFLHGFSVLSDNATFFYKCDNNYSKEAENGVNPLDKSLNIDWGIDFKQMVLSQKDEQDQSFEAYKAALYSKISIEYIR